MASEPGLETRIGLIVPSSNTNAEPLTAAILRDSRVVALASRFPLPGDLDAVIDERLLGPPADLIAAADVACMAFHGTSGSWLGLERDRQLCAALLRRTGVPTTTASLATVEAVRALGASRVGLVFPGRNDLADGIADEYRRLGIDVVHTYVPPREMSNPEISRLTFEEIDSLVASGHCPDVDAVVCVGTNLRAAYRTTQLEQRLGVPVVDSAAATAWQLLRLAGVDHRPSGWGRLFDVQVAA